MNNIEKRLGFITPKGTYPTILNDNTFSYYEQLCALVAVIEELNTEIEGKQDALTFDPLPVANSTNPVYSGGVYSELNLLSQLLRETAGALAERIGALETAMTFDAEPTQNSQNLVKSGGIWSAIHDAVVSLTQAIAAKQDILTWDTAPTNGSTNPVTSDGIYDALRELQQTINGFLDGKQNTLTFDQTPTENSTNPVTSGGVYTAVKQLDTAIQGKQATVITDTFSIVASAWTLSGSTYSTTKAITGLTTTSRIIIINPVPSISIGAFCTTDGTLTLETNNSAIATTDLIGVQVLLF